MIEITFEDRTILLNRGEIELIEYNWAYKDEVLTIVFTSGRQLIIKENAKELWAQLREALE